MLTSKKPQIEKLLEPLVKPFSGVNPNILTLLGSIPPLLFFVFVLTNHYVWALIAFMGTLIDTIDGMIARRYNKVTNFGGFFDSTMDRIGDFFIITAFSFANIVRWEIGAPVLLFSFLISYIRAQGGVRSGGDGNFAAGVGIIERAERYIFVIIALIAYIIFPNINIAGFNTAECTFLLIGLLSFYTVLVRMNYAYKKL